MVVDNLAHPQDSGQVIKEESKAVTLDISPVIPEPFTQMNTIVRLESGQSSTLYRSLLNGQRYPSKDRCEHHAGS